MIENYETVANEYRNMQYKSDIEPIRTLPEPIEEIEEEKPKKSNWELVQEKRKKKD